MKTTIIAEVGVNHNGSLDLARRLTDACAAAGADVVKFQTFVPSELATSVAPKADYQKSTTGTEGSQLQMLQDLSLSEQDHRILAGHCRDAGVEYCSSPFDLPSVESLKTFDLPFWKIPSGEITNTPLLRAVGRMNASVVVSTGMSTLADIENAIGILIKAGTDRGRITLLHCHTQYPTDPKDVNLNCMDTLRGAFGLPVGYSDHTEGIVFPIAAVAMGAVVLEKHITLDKSMNGPDHKASADPVEFEAMVSAIRDLEKGFGSHIKGPTLSELPNLAVARKSIVASRPIAKGQVITEDDLTTKRPATGISPLDWDNVIGCKAPRSFIKDEIIVLHD